MTTGADRRTRTHRTLVESIDRLDHIAALGFDIVYLPPIHPIGSVQRKGRNNSTTASPDDVGQPMGDRVPGWWPHIGRT